MKNFEYFRRFINLNGMNEQEADSFNQLVFQLYERSKALWVPRRCRDILGLDSMANEIMAERGISCFNDVKLKRFLREHFCLTSKLKRNEDILIIDPTGLPTNLVDQSDYQPYFGLVDNALPFSMLVYHQLQDLDKNGTEDVPYVFKFTTQTS